MGRCIGIDLGTKRVGLALSDSLNIIASPFKTLTFIDNDDLVSKLSNIITVSYTHLTLPTKRIV